MRRCQHPAFLPLFAVLGILVPSYRDRFRGFDAVLAVLRAAFLGARCIFFCASMRTASRLLQLGDSPSLHIFTEVYSMNLCVSLIEEVTAGELCVQQETSSSDVGAAVADNARPLPSPCS